MKWGLSVQYSVRLLFKYHWLLRGKYRNETALSLLYWGGEILLAFLSFNDSVEIVCRNKNGRMLYVVVCNGHMSAWHRFAGMVRKDTDHFLPVPYSVASLEPAWPIVSMFIKRHTISFCETMLMIAYLGREV